jgi:hypothetical protein
MRKLNAACETFLEPTYFKFFTDSKKLVMPLCKLSVFLTWQFGDSGKVSFVQLKWDGCLSQRSVKPSSEVGCLSFVY